MKQWREGNLKEQMNKIIAVFLFMIAIILIIIMKKDIIIENEIISFASSWVDITTDDEYMEQTWAPNVKNIAGVKIPFKTDYSFTGTMELKIFSDNYEEISSSLITYNFIEDSEDEMLFSFENVKVDIGSRYRFQFRFLEDSERGSIKILAKDNLAGASVNGNEIGKTISLKILTIKNSRLFWLLSSFFPFLIIALFIAVYFNRKIEDTLGISFITVIILLFLFGLIEQLQMGILFVYLLSVLSLIVTINLSIKKKVSLFSFITPGIVMYGGVIGYVMLTCHDLFRREWDEYSHWGLAVKDMFYYDAFAKHIDSSVWLQRYPPFSTLVEYFFMYNNEMFSEGILYVAYLSFLFSLLIVFFSKCKWNTVTYNLIAGIIVILLPMVFFDHYYFIYVDLLLGVLSAYVLVCYFSEKLTGFNIIRIGGGLVALVLTKDMGLVIALLFVGAVIIDQLFFGNECNFKIKKWKIIISAGAAALIPFIIWQIYIMIPAKSVTMNVGKTSSTIVASKISISGVIELLSMEAPEYRYQIIKDYIKILFMEDTFWIGNIGFSYISILIVISIILLYLYRKTKDIRLIRVIVMSMILSVGYLLFLLVTYLFSFPVSDAVVLHSHRRYFASCIGGVCIAIAGILLLNDAKKSNSYMGWLSILCAVLFFGIPLDNLYPNNLDTYIKAETIAGYDEIERTFQCFADKNEAVYYVYNNSRNGALEKIIFRNYASPLESEGGTFFVSEKAIEKEKYILNLKGKKDETIVSDKIKTMDEWEKELQEYEYVFLHRPGEVFAESYGSLFEKPETIDEKTYYRVEKKEGKIKLCYLGKVQ